MATGNSRASRSTSGKSTKKARKVAHQAATPASSKANSVLSVNSSALSTPVLQSLPVSDEIVDVTSTAASDTPTLHAQEPDMAIDASTPVGVGLGDHAAANTGDRASNNASNYASNNASNNASNLRGRAAFVLETTPAGVTVRTARLSDDTKLIGSVAVFSDVHYAINLIDQLKRQVVERFSRVANDAGNESNSSVKPPQRRELPGTAK